MEIYLRSDRGTPLWSLLSGAFASVETPEIDWPLRMLIIRSLQSLTNYSTQKGYKPVNFPVEGKRTRLVSRWEMDGDINRRLLMWVLLILATVHESLMVKSQEMNIQWVTIDR